LVPQLFTINPPPESAVPFAARGRTIAVRRVSVAAPFDGRELVYRTGPYRLERDPYAILAAPPAALLTEAIRSHLPQPDSVDWAAQVREAHGPDLQLDVDVGELSGDFTHPEQAAGVIVVTFRVSSANAASPFFRKVYTRRVVLSKRTAEAVVTAWNEALAEVLGELERDLAVALSGRPIPLRPAGN
jgi:uncharacterized lipoprotein YmbA